MADKEEFAHMRDDGSMRENDDDDVTASDESEEETDLDETYEPDELPVSFRADSRADSRAHNKRGKKEPEAKELTEEDLYGNTLSRLELVGPGLACAYTHMDLQNRRLTDVSMLERYIHLRFLDVSQNCLDDVQCVSAMSNLVLVNASKNRLRHLQLEDLPYLQSANFSHNKLTTLESLSQPMLEKLNVSSNRIQRLRFLEPDRLQNLRVLEMRSNKLETLQGSYPPTLQELYVASNLLTTIGHMTGVANLRVLHARDNQLESVAGVTTSDFRKLSYLNLRGNSIEDAKSLKPLRQMASLKEIMVEGNPLTDTDDYIDATLAALGVSAKVTRIDKHRVTDEDREYARVTMEKLDADDQRSKENLQKSDVRETADKSTDAEISFTFNTSISS